MLDEKGEAAKVLPDRQPLGMSAVKIDENGRLKLPVKIKEFLDKFPDKTFFCSTLDGRIGEIFPLTVWQVRQRWLDSSPNQVIAKRTKVRATRFGCEADLDSQGRITLPPQLRAGIKLQGAQEVWVKVDRGSVQILTQEVYDELARESDVDPVGDLEALEALGFGTDIK